MAHDESESRGKLTRIDASHARTRGSRRVGLMAGWGRYPIVVAEALRQKGYRTYCLGVTGHADPKLADICDEFQWTGVAKVGGAIRYFKRHGVTEVTMAGKFHKVVLFQPWLWLRLVPDLRTIRVFIPHFLTRRLAPSSRAGDPRARPAPRRTDGYKAMILG